MLSSHRFYGWDDEILVVDEWPDEASFQTFFDASPEIKNVWRAVGMTAQPEIKVWRKLDTRDGPRCSSDVERALLSRYRHRGDWPPTYTVWKAPD